MSLPAGLENRLARFIQALHPQYAQSLLVIARRIHPAFEETLAPLCEIYHYKYWRRVKLPGFIREARLRLWGKRQDPDAIICYSQLSHPKVLEALFEHGRRCPRIYYEGGILWYKGREAAPLLKQFDYFVANSSASRAILHERFAIPWDNITTILNGISTDYYERAASTELDPERFAEEWARAKRRHILLCTARLVPKKGVNLLVRMMAHLGDDYELWVLGSGSESERLQVLADALGVTDKVRFYGFQTDPVPYLKMADVLLVPSISEPMGNAILEAGSARLPVIAANIDGNGDIIVDGDSGVLLEPSLAPESVIKDFRKPELPESVYWPQRQGLARPLLLDPRELADAVQVLCKDGALRERYGANLQKRIGEQFLVQRTVEQFNAFLRRCRI